MDNFQYNRNFLLELAVCVPTTFQSSNFFSPLEICEISSISRYCYVIVCASSHLFFIEKKTQLDLSLCFGIHEISNIISTVKNQAFLFSFGTSSSVWNRKNRDTLTDFYYVFSRPLNGIEAFILSHFQWWNENWQTKENKRENWNTNEKIEHQTKNLQTHTHTQNTDYQTQRSRNGRKPLEIMTKIYFKHFSRAHFLGADLKAYQAFHCVLCNNNVYWQYCAFLVILLS